MILIRSVDAVIVKENVSLFLNDFTERSFGSFDTVIPGEQEIVVGHEFTKPNGQKIILGMTKDVENKIGFPLRCVSDLAEKLSKATAKNYQYQLKLNDKEFIINVVSQADFWTRLKWLFTGIKIRGVKVGEIESVADLVHGYNEDD